MPVNIQEITANNESLTYDIKFFHPKLTGNGTTGIIGKSANPAFIDPAIAAKYNTMPQLLIRCKKNSYTNNGVETLTVPFYLIPDIIWDKCDVLVYPIDNTNELVEFATPKNGNKNKIYTKMIAHSLEYSHSKKINTNGQSVIEKSTIVCYQLLLFNVFDTKNSQHIKCNDVSSLAKCHSNSYVTLFTCTPMQTYETAASILQDENYDVNTDAITKYINSYSLYDEICRLSQQWQTDIHNIIENLIAPNPKILQDDSFSHICKLINRIEDYNIPLDLYKSIYNVLCKHISSHTDVMSLCKFNLNLLLLDTLSRLAYYKPQLTSVPKIKMQTSKPYSNEQLNALTTSEPLALVQAGAGTGKSTVILGRIDYMIQAGINPNDITVLSFTNAAADNILLRNPNVHSYTIASMVDKIYAENYKHKLSNTQTVINAIRIYFPYDPIANEFAKRLTKLENNNAFTQINTFIEQNFNDVIRILDAIGQTTLALQIIICYQNIDNLKEPDTIKSKYLIIDEVQDNSIFEFVYLLKYIAKHNESLFMVGDCSQTLYEFRASNPKALNVLEGSGVFATYQLQTNYRSNQEILDFANVLLGNIQANQYANIQLQANSLMGVTEQSFTDKVKLNYEQLSKMKDLQLGTILARCAYDYIKEKLSNHEQVVFLAYSRKNVTEMETTLKQLFPTYNIVNIVPQKTYPVTVFSKYIDKYWNELQFLGNNIICTITTGIYNRINELMPKRLNTADAQAYVSKVVGEWQNRYGATITVWENEYQQGLITLDMLLQRIKENMIDFEITQNAVKSKIISTKNEKNKGVNNIESADCIVSTIHSAKGLEFDNAVIFHHNGEYTNEEDKRMYYVAFTRAKKTEFIISVGTGSHPKIQSDYNTIVEFLKNKPNTPLVLPTSKPAAPIDVEPLFIPKLSSPFSIANQSAVIDKFAALVPDLKPTTALSDDFIINDDGIIETNHYFDLSDTTDSDDFSFMDTEDLVFYDDINVPTVTAVTPFLTPFPMPLKIPV